MDKGERYQVRNIKLAEAGLLKVEWAERHMPVLMQLRQHAQKDKPLKGMRVAGCLHVTKETAVLLRTLKAAGAELAWSGCNPLSTQDDIAAALANEGHSIYAWHGMSVQEFYWAIDKTLEMKPTLTLDDGADLITTLHTKHQDLARKVMGGTEETTTGVHRLRAMAEDGKLIYPVVAVNDAETKWDFDNVYGTGQSSIDGILRSTNVLLAGKNFVTAGYGHCGRGVTMRARGLGAITFITEINPIAALKAALEGHTVVTMDEAAPLGDVFITATGMKDVIVKRHFEQMRDGAIVCNTGHYDCEVNIKELSALAKSHRTIRPNCEEYVLPNGRRIYVLAEGRLVNLAGAEGHPSEVMDMSFANQFLGLCWLAQHGKDLAPRVYDIPADQDQRIASIKLSSMGMGLDKLTPEQDAYRDDYLAGT
jgi:adenosylhomocysteinase